MTTTIRATVMLAVLVGLPAAWVYYGPLPNQAQRVVDRFVEAAKESIGWEDRAAEAPRESAIADRDPAHAPAFVPLAAEPPAAAAAEAPTLAQQLEPLLARLKALGVEEYVLEPWGDGSRLFRFRCEMPLTVGGQATEQFEAISADPQASIEQVVSDVTSWQRARSGGAVLQ